MDIFFSIIIPAYNSEAYIGEAIESALMQTKVKSEVIVVNDGSTDGTLDIVNNFRQRVRVVSQKNGGLSSARNSGARLALGNTLAFLDSDDIWLPGKLYSQSLKLQYGFKIVYTNRFNIGQIGDLPEMQSDVTKMTEGDIWLDLLHVNMITASSSVIQKELFEQQGGFRNDLRSCEDWDLWLRCAAMNKIGYCSEPLLKYRMHAGGLSKNYRFMSEMRTQVISNALSSERGGQLDFITRRKIHAHTWATSGWDAARGKDLHFSLKCYLKSLYFWPFSYSTLYDVARCIAGRA